MIYLLRHGQTTWNVEGRYQGCKDSALTKHGRVQAVAVAQLLSRSIDGATPHSCFVSPLGRAQETADIVLRELSSFPRFIEPRIQEVTLGAWDGLTKHEIETEYPGALAGSSRYEWYFRAPGGEAFESVCDRVQRWLQEIPEPVIAISHGVVGRFIRGIYANLSREDLLSLPVPQDGFHILQGGSVSFVSSSR